MKRTDFVTIRSKTNDGKPSKQSFCLAKEEGKDIAIIIYKLILSDIDDLHLIETGYIMVKTFKNVAIYRQSFSIKKDTLVEAMLKLHILHK